MSRALLLPALAVLLLSGCGEPREKIVTILGPERIVQVPAKVDPRLTTCMDVDLPSVDLIPLSMPPEKVAAVLGVQMNRYKMAWDDCRSKLKAIEAAQPVE